MSIIESSFWDGAVAKKYMSGTAAKKMLAALPPTKSKRHCRRTNSSGTAAKQIQAALPPRFFLAALPPNFCLAALPPHEFKRHCRQKCKRHCRQANSERHCCQTFRRHCRPKKLSAAAKRHFFNHQLSRMRNCHLTSSSR